MKITKITSLLNPINLIQKVNDLIDVARSPLKRSTAYVVGDIVHVYALPSNLYLECIQAGTTSYYDLTVGSTVNAQLTDGSVKWIVRDKNDVIRKSGVSSKGNATTPIYFDVNGVPQQTKNFNDYVKIAQGSTNKDKILYVNDAGNVDLIDVPDPLPVGIVLSFAGSGLPNNYLLCDGSSLLIANYQSLYNVIGKIYGGDSTHFKLPNLIDKFIQGNSTSGVVKDAGLPNITGNIATIGLGGTVDGAFYRNGRASDLKNDGDADWQVSFDASLSNPIYGNSNTVQPPAVTMRYIIKYQ